MATYAVSICIDLPCSIQASDTTTAAAVTAACFSLSGCLWLSNDVNIEAYVEFLSTILPITELRLTIFFPAEVWLQLFSDFYFRFGISPENQKLLDC